MSKELTEESSHEEPSSKLLYEQLLSEYNKLLKKHAAAENTIDQLRTGATVHLYTEPLENRSNSRLSNEAARYHQNISLPRGIQANISPISAMNESCSIYTTGGRSEEMLRQKRKESLEARIVALKDDINTVESFLNEGNITAETLDELAIICSQLHKEYGHLVNESRHHATPSNTSNFSTKSEMEKDLGRLKLRIEESQSDIRSRQKIKGQDLAISKPFNDEKPALATGLENLIKEMKDLKDASMKSSDEVLKSSRKENAKRRHDPLLQSKSNQEQRRHSEPTHDTIDSQYFTASPVDTMFQQSGILSESSGSADEQCLNKTWPPLNTRAESSVKNFFETTQDSPQHDKKISSYEKLGCLSRSDDCYERELESSRLLKSSRPSQTQVEFDHDMDNFSSKLVDSETSYSVRKQSMEERHRFDYKIRGNESRDLEGRSHNCNRENDSFEREDLSYEREEYLQTDYKEHTPNFDEELLPKKDKRSSKSVEKYQLPRSNGPRRHNSMSSLAENKRYSTDNPNLQSPEPRKSNSMSSVAGSSRMSTPLFQPRGATRSYPRASKYKWRNASDGLDSGFVGSEASRRTTNETDGIQKLSLPNQWDSSLQLDLVSEMDENESRSSPGQVSTTYELTEDVRPLPKITNLGDQHDGDIKFINSSPTPPSSTERTPRTPEQHFGNRSSRLPSDGHSSADHDMRHYHLSLSHDNRRLPSEHRPSTEEGSLRTRGDECRINQEYNQSELKKDRVPSEERKLPLDSLRKFQSLRSEIDMLHDHVNKQDHARVKAEIYDELREHDEQLRKIDERRHERKLNELKQTVEDLKREMKTRNLSQKHHRKIDTQLYDEFRSELQTLADKLEELISLDTSEKPQISLTTRVSPQDPLLPNDDDIPRRFTELVHKVEQLRLKVENDAPHEKSRTFCRRCKDTLHHAHPHSNRAAHTADHQPRTSTPYVVDPGPMQSEKLNHGSYLSSTYPGVSTPRSPVIHHIHTYHRGPALKEYSSSEEDDLVKRTPSHKRRVRRTRYRTRLKGSFNDHLALDEARKAAWDVQRLSKNILNSITLDLTSLRS